MVRGSGVRREKMQRGATKLRPGGRDPQSTMAEN